MVPLAEGSITHFFKPAVPRQAQPSLEDAQTPPAADLPPPSSPLDNPEELPPRPIAPDVEELSSDETEDEDVPPLLQVKSSTLRRSKADALLQLRKLSRSPEAKQTWSDFERRRVKAMEQYLSLVSSGREEVRARWREIGSDAAQVGGFARGWGGRQVAKWCKAWVEEGIIPASKRGEYSLSPTSSCMTVS